MGLKTVTMTAARIMTFKLLVALAFVATMCIVNSEGSFEASHEAALYANEDAIVPEDQTNDSTDVGEPFPSEEAKAAAKAKKVAEVKAKKVAEVKAKKAVKQ